MTQPEVRRSPFSVCSAGGEEEREKGSCGDGSQYSACRGSPASLLLSQSHDFGAEGYHLQKQNGMVTDRKTGLLTISIN